MPGVPISRQALAMVVNQGLLRRARVSHRGDAIYPELLYLTEVLGGLSGPVVVVAAPQAEATLTTAQFAEAAHISVHGARDACRTGRVRASKHGRDWVIPAAELVRWQAAR